MDQKILEEAYWKILADITKMPDIKNTASFTFMDTDAWIWSVRIYTLLIRDYCANLPFDKNVLRRHIVTTNRISSKHDQARKVLVLLGIEDEQEEGWWFKQFRRELDQVSGKGGQPDRRSFTPGERPRFLDRVKILAEKVEFTSITLCLALIGTARTQSSEEKWIAKLLKILPDKAEEFFMLKSYILR